MAKNNSKYFFTALLISLLTGLSAVWYFAFTATEKDCPFKDNLILILGIYTIFNFALFFVLAGFYYKNQKQYEKNGSRFLEHIDILCQDLTKTKDSLKHKEEELQFVTHEKENVKNLNKTYENIIYSLRQIINKESDKIKDGCRLLEEIGQKAMLSDKLKSAFIANIDHEIRTPINGILGYAMYLTTPNLTEEKRRQFSEILSFSIARFLNTINDIVYYSQLKAGDITTTNNLFDINLLIANILNLGENFKHNLKRNIEINVTNDLREKKYIKGFENGYYKILSNLMNNAVKFTKEGSVEISYVLTEDKIKITISDTGVGFNLSEKNNIFDSFRQEDITLARKFDGMGLGLSICKALTNLMDGEIFCESHKNIGSKFWIEIPLKVPENKPDIYNRIENFIKPQNIKRKKILIYATNDEDFIYINGFCRSYNFESQRAMTTDDIVSLVKSDNEIYTIVIDIEYFMLEALRCAKKITDYNPQIRFAFFTTESLSESQIEKISVYSDIIITKPFNTQSINRIFETF